MIREIIELSKKEGKIIKEILILNIIAFVILPIEIIFDLVTHNLEFSTVISNILVIFVYINVMLQPFKKNKNRSQFEKLIAILLSATLILSGIILQFKMLYFFIL